MMSMHGQMGKLRHAVLICVLLGYIAFSHGLLHAQQPAEHPVLKKMTGDWKSTGELNVSEDGSVIALSEQWTGSTNTEGHLVIEGTRRLNEDEQSFRWVYFFNTATELYEAIYTDSNSDEEKTWQISINEAEGVIEMQVPFGSGTTLRSKSKVSDDRVVADVAIVDPGGGVAVNGTITHVREGAAKNDD